MHLLARSRFLVLAMGTTTRLASRVLPVAALVVVAVLLPLALADCGDEDACPSTNLFKRACAGGVSVQACPEGLSDE